MELGRYIYILSISLNSKYNHPLLFFAFRNRISQFHLLYIIKYRNKIYSTKVTEGTNTKKFCWFEFEKLIIDQDFKT